MKYQEGSTNVMEDLWEVPDVTTGHRTANRDIVPKHKLKHRGGKNEKDRLLDRKYCIVLNLLSCPRDGVVPGQGAEEPSRILVLQQNLAELIPQVKGVT